MNGLDRERFTTKKFGIQAEQGQFLDQAYFQHRSQQHNDVKFNQGSR